MTPRNGTDYGLFRPLDLDEAETLRRLQAQMRSAQAEFYAAAAALDDTARRYVEAGIRSADIARVLGVSKQNLHQRTLRARAAGR